MFQPGVTVPRKLEKGRPGLNCVSPTVALKTRKTINVPPSRAKDQICRDAVATSLKQAATSVVQIIAVMVFVAP